MVKRMDTFGNLTVLGRSGHSSSGQQRWRCVCFCGRPYLASESSLKFGLVKHCGCLSDRKRGPQTKHGRSNSSVHSIWMAMRRRCNSTNCPAYPRYGGRGITVCERWNDFANFYADMGERALTQAKKGT
jgi:hypothetical protein